MKPPARLSLSLMFVLFTTYAFSAQFRKPVLYTVGVEPQQTVVADFNHDGNLDLVMPDFTSLQLTVLLGNGDGTFRHGKQLPTALDGSVVAVADFNGDGNLDIAAAEYGFGGPGTLQIFLGKGDGTFETAITHTIAPSPYDMTVADLNGDGIADLAIASNGTNAVTVMFGNGDGTFQKAVFYYVPLPERVLAVDLNHDGHPDLAVLAYCGSQVKTCRSGAVVILLNNGDGTFGSPSLFDTKGIGPDGIVAADLNRDGNTDLVVSNNNFQSPSVLSVFLGNSDGTLQPVVNYPAGSGPAGMAIADFNGDGNLDVAAANTGSSDVSLFYGNGDGTLQPARSLTFAAGSLPIWVAAGDFNGDGAMDAVVVLDYANEVAILLNTR
jgi:hypothetical protein